MTYEEVIERMIAGCLRQMEAKGQHVKLTDEQRRAKAEVWAKDKYERDLMNAQKSSQTVTRTIRYELILTPSMMVAGEIGIAMVDSFGEQRVAYSSFDFANWKFSHFEDSSAYDFTGVEKPIPAPKVRKKKSLVEILNE